MSTSLRICSALTLIGVACVVSAGLVACGDGHAAPNARHDAGADAAAEDGGAIDGSASCETRCAPDETPSSTSCACDGEGVRMRLARLSEGFFAQPWPLSTRLRADGTLDLDNFPTPLAALFVLLNLPTIATQTHGFSTNGAIFTSFDGPLDPDSLPTTAQSLDRDAAAYLVEVGASSTAGERMPITCSYRERASDYNPPYFVACAPVPGFPLRPHTTYALVLTDALRDPAGEALRPSQRWLDILHGRDAGDDALAAELVDAYAPLVDALSGQDHALDHVIGGSVFETQDPVAGLRALAADVQALDPPGATSLLEYGGMLPSEAGNYVALEGTYDTPIYQQGETPYAVSGGDIQFNTDGTPIRNGTLSLRFGLTLPDGPMPKRGWPVVLYHHGSGGDAYSFISDGTAYHLAAAGVAAIGIDAPVHGTRKAASDDAETLFFNIGNVLALRDNIRQGAVDLLALERFVEAFTVDAADSPTGKAIRFDTDGIFAMGHSQGGLTVPLMLPFSRHVKGAMLSGAGASITASIIYKTEPLDIPSIARSALGLAPTDPLDVFHPVLALVQAFSDVSDGGNYAPYLYRWPGGRGIDVWATQGLLDTYAPKPVTDALVTAYGLQPMAPLVEPVDGLALRGIAPIDAPVRENIEAVSGGRFTGVYSQYPDDDHFLIMDDPDAQAQLTHWFEALAKDGHGELITP